MDELPQPGRTVSTSKHSVTPGGKGANQAAGAAKLGNRVSLLGKVGSDYDSNIIYTCMENHVDVQGVKRDVRSETGKAYIHVQKDGESAITILAGANQSLLPQDTCHMKNCSKMQATAFSRPKSWRTPRKPPQGWQGSTERKTS